MYFFLGMKLITNNADYIIANEKKNRPRTIFPKDCAKWGKRVYRL